MSITNSSSQEKKISELIDESGLGEINFGDSFEQMGKALDKYGIEYSREGNAIVFPDGTFYDGECLSLTSTQKGLKIGDNESQITKIYGEPNKEKFTEGSWTYYRYDFGTKTANGKSIWLEIVAEAGKVFTIALYEDVQYTAGGAPAW